MDFFNQYKHPEWQKKRLQVMEAHDYKCQFCGAREQELHVHHPIYRKGAKVWEYEVGELRCLCKTCHDMEHLLLNYIKEVIAGLSLEQKSKVAGYADGLTSTAFHGIGPMYRHGFVDALRGDTERIKTLIPMAGE